MDAPLNGLRTASRSLARLSWDGEIAPGSSICNRPLALRWRVVSFVRKKSELSTDFPPRASFASLRGRPLHFGEPSRRERGFRLRNLSAAYRLLFVFPYYVFALAAFAALGFSAVITDESLTWYCVYLDG